MKRLLMILLLTMLSPACSRAASLPPPTQPALDFPIVTSSPVAQCQTSDLKTSSNFAETGGAIVLGVTLTNVSKNPCELTNPPQASVVELPLRVVDASGKDLDLQILAIPAAQTPPAPALIQLAPGESVIVSLVWRNYCQALPAEGLGLRLQLAPAQVLEVELDVVAAPRCDSKSEPSTLSVAPYSFPP